MDIVFDENFNNVEIINDINRIYYSFKGTSDLVPAVGRNGCAKFAVLLWLFDSLAKKDIEKMGEISISTSGLFHPIILAFNGCPDKYFAKYCADAIENTGGRALVLEFENICADIEKDNEIYNSIKNFEFAAESTKITLQNYEKTTKISDLISYSEQLGMRILDKISCIK